ncbi:MAG: hypothetical protein RLZZ516_2407 [Cyanobacteriota bacterium]|jgi:hypothetical protein
MNRTKPLHPVEARLLVAMAVLWAVAVLARAVLLPMVALLLTVGAGEPQRSPLVQREQWRHQSRR